MNNYTDLIQQLGSYERLQQPPADIIDTVVNENKQYLKEGLQGAGGLVLGETVMSSLRRLNKSTDILKKVGLTDDDLETIKTLASERKFGDLGGFLAQRGIQNARDKATDLISAARQTVEDTASSVAETIPSDIVGQATTALSERIAEAQGGIGEALAQAEQPVVERPLTEQIADLTRDVDFSPEAVSGRLSTFYENLERATRIDPSRSIMATEATTDVNTQFEEAQRILTSVNLRPRAPYIPSPSQADPEAIDFRYERPSQSVYEETMGLRERPTLESLSTSAREIASQGIDPSTLSNDAGYIRGGIRISAKTVIKDGRLATVPETQFDPPPRPVLARLSEEDSPFKSLSGQVIDPLSDVEPFTRTASGFITTEEELPPVVAQPVQPQEPKTEDIAESQPVEEEEQAEQTEEPEDEPTAEEIPKGVEDLEKVVGDLKDAAEGEEIAGGEFDPVQAFTGLALGIGSYALGRFVKTEKKEFIQPPVENPIQSTDFSVQIGV